MPARKKVRINAMWKRFLIGLVIAALLIGFWLWEDPSSQRSWAKTGHLLPGILALEAQPGTAEDPVVTKSYVDQFNIPQVIELKDGQSVFGEAGTQFILRSGSARCLADPTTTKGGLSDVTAGIDIGHLMAVAPNHMLICPRSDGRGLFADTPAVLLVWGIYRLQGG
jgi:hypothetical protein